MIRIRNQSVFPGVAGVMLVNGCYFLYMAALTVFLSVPFSAITRAIITSAAAELLSTSEASAAVGSCLKYQAGITHMFGEIRIQLRDGCKQSISRGSSQI